MMILPARIPAWTLLDTEGQRFVLLRNPDTPDSAMASNARLHVVLVCVNRFSVIGG